MPYINLDVGYWGSKDARRLNARLGRGADAIPPRIWCYVGEHYPETGRLSGYTPAEIEEIGGWWGKTGEAVAALESPEIAVLGKDELGYFVRNWEKHNGHIVSFAIRARSGAEGRWKKYRVNKEIMLEARASNASSNAPTIPSVPTVPTKPTLPYRSTEKRCGWEEGGVKACTAPAELNAMYCRDHILKAQEMKSPRSGSWKV